MCVESASQGEICPQARDTQAAPGGCWGGHIPFQGQPLRCTSLPALQCPCVSLCVRRRRSRAGRNPSMPAMAERPVLDPGPALNPLLTWAHTSPPQTWSAPVQSERAGPAHL